MRLVVGLGNPGPRYEGTRHNVGFRVGLAFASRCGAAFAPRFDGRFAEARFGGAPLGLLLPGTPMNASGRAVEAAVRALDPSALLVVFDDLDLPLGRLRLRPGGGDGGHRGLRDVLACLEGEVPRLRVGIGRPPLGSAPVDHVLARFEPAEEALLEAATRRAVETIGVFLTEGVVPAMNLANARRDGDAEQGDPTEPSEPGERPEG